MLAPNLGGSQYKTSSSSADDNKNNPTLSLLSKSESEDKEQSSINQPLPLTQALKDKYTGTLYKYGGRGEVVNGNTLYDCSGLAHAVGKERGYNIPYESTSALAKSKYYNIIDPNDVKSGDLAVWSGHVGVVDTPINGKKMGTLLTTSGSKNDPKKSRIATFGPGSHDWKEPKFYLRPKDEYLNQAAPKNAAAAQKKPSPPKVVPAPVAAKNSTSIAEEKNTPSGYDLLNSMMSVLKHLSVPNLQHVSQALLARQPEDYRSAKGGGCCCASGPPSTVINQNTSITLNSACKDPQELGNIVANAQDKVNRDVVRKIIPRTS